MEKRLKRGWSRIRTNNLIQLSPGSAIVNAIGSIRQVQGEDKIQRRYLVIAPGAPDRPGAPVQIQAE